MWVEPSKPRAKMHPEFGLNQSDLHSCIMHSDDVDIICIMHIIFTSFKICSILLLLFGQNVFILGKLFFFSSSVHLVRPKLSFVKDYFWNENLCNILCQIFLKQGKILHKLYHLYVLLHWWQKLVWYWISLGNLHVTKDEGLRSILMWVLQQSGEVKTMERLEDRMVIGCMWGWGRGLRNFLPPNHSQRQ